MGSEMCIRDRTVHVYRYTLGPVAGYGGDRHRDLGSAPCGATDAEMKVPSAENTKLPKILSHVN